jgi:cell surface protein SprA
MNTHLTPSWLYFLATRLANDEVLAVAYQYTIGDKYQVGEFGNDGVDATIVTGNAFK